jgi:hypothetical protein
MLSAMVRYRRDNHGGFAGERRPRWSWAGTLWLLKQAFYFSLTTVNDAVKEHGVSIAQIGVLRQLANQRACRRLNSRAAADHPAGRSIGFTALEKRGFVERRKRSPSTGGSCRSS